MKITKFRFLLLVTVSILTYVSCRKMDRAVEVEKIDPVTKFFTIPASTDPSVKRVADKIRSQNETSSFVNQFIKKQGFAIWDQSIVKHFAYLPVKQKSGVSGRTTSDSTDLVIIPLVRTNEHQVHGALACTIIDDSITIHLLDGSQYNWYNQHPDSAGNNGEQLSIMLMQLDKTVFGHNYFRITDTTAFGLQTGEKVRYIKLLPTQGNAGSHRWAVETVTVTYVTYEDLYQGQLHGCVPGDPNCNEYQEITHTILFQHYVWIDDGATPSPDPWYDPNGGGGGGGGGGNGGGNGNGETPWVPVEGDPSNGGTTNPYPLPPYVLNNLTKPCLKAALNKLSGGTTNTFFRQIFNVFDTASNLHISISEDSLSNAYGNETYFSSSAVGPFVVINLDTAILLNCSQEWIAYVLIHEIAHAGMDANIIQWDTTNSQHDAMMFQYLTQMATNLTAAYPGLSMFDAYSICYTGFNNAIDGITADPSLLYIMLKQVKAKLNDQSVTAQQLVNRGEQYNVNGTLGLRTGCN